MNVPDFFLLNSVSISGFCTSMLPTPDINELKGPVLACGAPGVLLFREAVSSDDMVGRLLVFIKPKLIENFSWSLVFECTMRSVLTTIF